MFRSETRILTTHAGALPRSAELTRLVLAKAAGEERELDNLKVKLRSEVAEVVRMQSQCGVDIVNDGELGKTNFNNYCLERISGYETRPYEEGRSPQPLSIGARDARRFPDYFSSNVGGFARFRKPKSQTFCVEPLRYVGHESLQEDLDNFRASLADVKVVGAFLPANTPGTIEHWMFNDYYKTTEEFLFAVADCMAQEYRAIVDAGFDLQIDDPDLPDGWLMYPDMSVSDYRKYAQLRIEALNHALRDIPREKIRLHVCWGSFHGPHHDDIPLKDIVDLVFSIRARSVSIEASNPAHEHEWRIFEDYKIPDDVVLIPGVIGHASDFIEHPELVAERLIRYANLVGRENVIAGTDCGLGNRVGHGSIAWAKLEAMRKGADIASRRLWG